MQELIQHILPGDQHPTLMRQKILGWRFRGLLCNRSNDIVGPEFIRPGQDGTIKAGRIGSVPNGFGDCPNIELIDLPTDRMGMG